MIFSHCFVCSEIKLNKSPLCEFCLTHMQNIETKKIHKTIPFIVCFLYSKNFLSFKNIEILRQSKELNLFFAKKILHQRIHFIKKIPRVKVTPSSPKDKLLAQSFNELINHSKEKSINKIYCSTFYDEKNVKKIYQKWKGKNALEFWSIF